MIHATTALPIPETDSLRFLPEGPIPLDNEGRLSWVAIQHGADVHHGSLNFLDLSSMTNRSTELPGRIGFAFPCDDGERFVAGIERSLGIFDPKRRFWEPFCNDIDADVSNTIINDGWVWKDNLIFGTKDLEFKTKKAGLYLYRGHDRQLIRLRADQICSNGKAIRTSADGAIGLIDIDSPTRTIVEYPLDIDAGTIGDPVVLIDLTSDPGVPDGAILTPDGTGIVVSIFMPSFAEFGETRHYDLASGELRDVWRTVGSPQNTCPALVKHDGKIRLLITTAVENMSAENRAKCPSAGQLFLGETAFRGELSLPVWPLSTVQ